MHTHEAQQAILNWLGLRADQLCPRCGGRGHALYGSTSTWRKGIGGAAMTTDICDSCWGTGRRDRVGTDLRKVDRHVKGLEQEVQRLRSAIEKHREQYHKGPSLDSADDELWRVLGTDT